MSGSLQSHRLQSHLSQSLLTLMSIEAVMPSNYPILCRPLLLLSWIFLSIRIFSNESALRIRWPNIKASTSASVFPVNIQDWSPLGSTGWISLQSKGLLRVFSRNIIWKESVLRDSIFFMAQLTHPYMTTEQTIALIIPTLLAKWCLCFSICCIGWS